MAGGALDFPVNAGKQPVTALPGAAYFDSADSFALQDSGPIRATGCLRGAFRNAAGERWLDFRLWVSVFAGLSRVLLEPLLIVNAEAGLVQRVRSLRLVLRPAAAISAAAVGEGQETATAFGDGWRLLQVDDAQYRLGQEARQGRAPGWAEATADAPL